MPTDFTLAPLPAWSPRPGPVVMVIMDGVGLGSGDEGDAVRRARTPNLDAIHERYLHTRLKAHGEAVGLPSDADMGNSEVGHNAFGCGRIFAQGAKLVSEAVASGSLFEGELWRRLVAAVAGGAGALHLIGLLSDGNVHSHMDHLLALIERADREGVERLRVHPLLDGRDVSEVSALRYVDALEKRLAPIDARPERSYRIASGGGRMVVTMDRYGADWGMVELGWRTHVHGEGRRFCSARAAIETLRAEHPGVIDQDLPPFVIGDDKGPVGRVEDGDAVVFFNFRGDRAIEISRAFEEGESFTAFDRGRVPSVLYAGMMQYDGDALIPKSFLVSPPHIDRTMGEHLAATGVAQLAIAETQKFGHVTYFWNGNRTGRFSEELETYIEIPSDRVAFETAPRMKAVEITDRLLEELETGRYRFARVNYANGDMVGHTGVLEAAVEAVEAVDTALGRVLAAVGEAGGVVLVTADHGNADEMYERDGRTGAFKTRDGERIPKTAHTLNPVPFVICDPAFDGEYRLAELERPGLANVAATVLNLLGYEAPEGYEPSLLVFQQGRARG